MSPFLPFGNYGLPTPPGQAIVTNPTATQPISLSMPPVRLRPRPIFHPRTRSRTSTTIGPWRPTVYCRPQSNNACGRKKKSATDCSNGTRQRKKSGAWSIRPRSSGKRKECLSYRDCNQPCRGSWAADQRKLRHRPKPTNKKCRLQQKPFTAELLRHQDFSVEEAFAQFSVLQGVKSRLKQFGYDFFDAHAGGFTSLQDVPVGPDYVIGPQDSFAVHIWNVPDQNFNRSYIAPVERDGMVVIPQIGAIPVGGQTFSQAERTIRAGSSSMLKRFEFHVSMARIRTMKVYVVGEVVRPGAYELSALATASNAIYAACGPIAVRVLASSQGHAGRKDRSGTWISMIF